MSANISLLFLASDVVAGSPRASFTGKLQRKISRKYQVSQKVLAMTLAKKITKDEKFVKVCLSTFYLSSVDVTSI